MAKLYRYPISGIWSQSTNIAYLTPLFTQEVIAGQSLHGTARIKLMSDSLKTAALNRMWFDIFVFYTPFRVLWDGWPDFISKGEGTIPTVNDTWGFNYEERAVLEGGLAGTAWQRHGTNNIWNKVFRSNKQAEIDLNQRDSMLVLNRARSWQSNLIAGDDYPLPVTTVDTTGDSFEIDALKRASVEQRKARLAYFFDDPTNQEYLQLLERMGVHPGWEIDDAPRLIGQYHARATFETVVSTGDSSSSTGSPSGFFCGTVDPVVTAVRFLE